MYLIWEEWNGKKLAYKVSEIPMDNRTQQQQPFLEAIKLPEKEEGLTVTELRKLHPCSYR